MAPTNFYLENYRVSYMKGLSSLHALQHSPGRVLHRRMSLLLEAVLEITLEPHHISSAHLWFKPRPKPDSLWADWCPRIFPHLLTTCSRPLTAQVQPRSRVVALGVTFNQRGREWPWVCAAAYPPLGGGSWDLSPRFSEVFGRCSLILAPLPFQSHYPPPPSLFCVTWNHLPNKWPAFKPLPQALILREPKLKYNLFHWSG